MTSTVHILVGQCGNQLGTALFDALTSEAEASQDEDYQLRVSTTHFRPAMGPAGRRPTAARDPAPARLPQPRCVMVDMEPKAIEEALRRVNGTGPVLADSTSRPRPSYCLAPQQCVTRGEGSANNWAYGYYEQGESRRDAIAECLRRESEASERGGAPVATYSVVHSVAGGTGSGVGCLVAEVVRELYPHASLVHSVVWPFAGGEVATQWLNTTLAMSSLQDSADAVCVAYNDEVAERLTRAQRAAARGGARPGADPSLSFDDLNRQIARLWAPLHLPQLVYAAPEPERDAAKYRVPQESVTKQVRHAPLPAPRRYACTEDIIEAVALDPARKLFTGLSVPNHAVERERMAGTAAGTSSWSAVLSDAARASRDTFHALPCASLMGGVAGRGALWLMRGYDARAEGLRALQDLLVDTPCAMSALLVSPDTGIGSVRGHSREVRRGDTAAAAAAASSRPAHEVTLYGHAPVIPEALSVALQRVEKQLRTSAYLYQYERYGVDKEAFRDCTMRLWDTVHAYSGQY